MVFEQHYANATATRTSLPNLFRSRYFAPPLLPGDPHVLYGPLDLFRLADPELVFFPDLLAAAGMRTALVSAHGWLVEDSVFADRFDEVVDLATPAAAAGRPYPRAPEAIDATLAWLDQHRDEEFFLYVHLMDTHFPHEFGPDARAFFGADEYVPRDLEPNGSVRDASGLDADDRRYLDALYDGSVRATSREIGRLLDHLEAAGRLDETLVVLTSDHGEHLLERPGLFYHREPWLEPVAHIPLIVRYPGRLEPGRFQGLSEMVDVAPTILSLLGVEPPAADTFDGRDLTVLDRRGRPSDAVYGRAGIRTPTHTLVLRASTAALLAARPPPPSELDGLLFDRVADPEELRDRFAAEPEAVAQLVDRLRTRLVPAFARYLRTWVNEPPPGSFAVGAHALNSNRPLDLMTTRDVTPGWTRGQSGINTWLTGSQTDETLTISVPLPDGDYHVSARVQGSGRITIEGRTQPLVAGEAYLTEVGDVEVGDQLFEATLSVAGAGPLVLHYLSFSPPDGSGPSRERLEQLRALGYAR